MGRPADIPPGARRALERPRAPPGPPPEPRPSPPRRNGRTSPPGPPRITRCSPSPARLEAEVAAEVGARLPRSRRRPVAEAILERQVLACSAPALEAITTATEPRPNRRPDRGHRAEPASSCLSSYLAGDADWRERHPANRAFLDALAGRGGSSWLSASAPPVRCASAPGGRSTCIGAGPPRRPPDEQLSSTPPWLQQPQPLLNHGQRVRAEQAHPSTPQQPPHVLGRKLISLGKVRQPGGFPHTYLRARRGRLDNSPTDIIARYAPPRTRPRSRPTPGRSPPSSPKAWSTTHARPRTHRPPMTHTAGTCPQPGRKFQRRGPTLFSPRGPADSS